MCYQGYHLCINDEDFGDMNSDGNLVDDSNCFDDDNQSPISGSKRSTRSPTLSENDNEEPHTVSSRASSSSSSSSSKISGPKRPKKKFISKQINVQSVASLQPQHASELIFLHDSWEFAEECDLKHRTKVVICL